VPITIPCPNCAKPLTFADDDAGKIVCCPACEDAFEVSPPKEDLVQPDDDLVEAELEPPGVTAKPVPPARRAAWDDDEPPAKPKPAKPKRPSSEDEDGEMYATDADDEDERKAFERERRQREKRRQREEEEDRWSSTEPHRGEMILILGIVALCSSFLCCLIPWGLGSIVLNMANTDLQRIDHRLMDPRGRSLTVAGRACGLIAVGLGMINAIVCIVITIGILSNSR
jgi:hypothetical protein